VKLNCELFYTDLRKFSAQSYICWAFLILPTSAHKEEMIVSQDSSRYFAWHFERRWRRRLNTPQWLTSTPFPLHVEVAHHFSAPIRYGWEIRPAAGLRVEESQVQFASWEEASQAGKLALKQFLPEG
jgi:hypothetical protein